MTSEERLHDERSQYYYGRDAWRGFLQASREQTENHLPDPEEILQGMRDIRWLREQGFPEEFVKSVLVFRSPRIDLVRRITESRGVDAAYQLLKDFMP